jgi:RNA polymerase sigma-70 factor (ECF subfamily)
MMDSSEEALVEAAQKGREEAFEKLFLRYRGPIASLAFQYTGNYQDAEELLQDIFVRSFLSIGRYRPMPDVRFFSWLYRIGINCAVNFVKKKQRRKFQTGSEANEFSDLASGPRNPEAQYVVREIREALNRALDALSPAQRMIFVLKHFEQMSTEETAAHMKCSEGSVRKQLFRAVVKLRREMAPYRRLES